MATTPWCGRAQTWGKLSAVLTGLRQTSPGQHGHEVRTKLLAQSPNRCRFSSPCPSTSGLTAGSALDALSVAPTPPQICPRPPLWEAFDFTVMPMLAESFDSPKVLAPKRKWILIKQGTEQLPRPAEGLQRAQAPLGTTECAPGRSDGKLRLAPCLLARAWTSLELACTPSLNFCFKNGLWVLQPGFTPPHYELLEVRGCPGRWPAQWQ